MSSRQSSQHSLWKPNRFPGSLGGNLILEVPIWESGKSVRDTVTGKFYDRAATTGDGPDWRGSNHGMGLHFDQDNVDLIDIPSILPDFSGIDFALEFYAKIDDYGPSGSIIFGTNTGVTWYNQFGQDTQVWIGGKSIGSNVSWDDGIYHHVVLTSSAAGLAVYRDGVLRGSSATLSNSVPSGVKNFNLGKWIGGGNWNWDGDIVYFRLFNRGFSDGEAMWFSKNWASTFERDDDIIPFVPAAPPVGGLPPSLTLLGVG